MAESSPKDFKNLLVHMRNLEVLDLSRKGVMSIPADMFKSNARLKRLTLLDVFPVLLEPTIYCLSI